MALIVQKFGGTSVADLDRIRHVATRVKQEVDAGNQVIVTVSAMAGTTDKLVGLVKDVSDLRSDEAWAEHDYVVSTGEQVTSGLLALHLQGTGVAARSFNCWQLPFHTDAMYGKARITNIETDAVKQALSEGKVAVIAGYQGINPDYRVTTLGRGGTDT